MSEPTAARPVPGPPRAAADDAAAVPAAVPAGDRPAPEESGPGAFGDLDARPVGEHVAVFEAEHDRLQRELGTIDQL